MSRERFILYLNREADKEILEWLDVNYPKTEVDGRAYSKNGTPVKTKAMVRSGFDDVIKKALSKHIELDRWSEAEHRDISEL